MGPQEAEVMALEALAWLAGRPQDIARFLTISGLAAEDLRKSVGDRQLQASVLDFLLGEEPLLLEYCRNVLRRPQTVHRARHLLEEPQE
ncbi:MAG: DUF3572 family protein [Rhizomicrobium sp.]